MVGPEAFRGVGTSFLGKARELFITDKGQATSDLSRVLLD